MTDINGTTILLIQREGMGSAAPELQLGLLQKYLQLTVENKTPPAAICFYTDGVKLVCEGSAILDLLRALESSGVKLIVCSTCLKYFGLADKVRLGIVGGMPDIIAALTLADKVITL